ncbi:hypothetical protein BBI01_01455 [Chryseobacterium artocarpi]|uniref:Uncharacterized protein n=1 Tax=Chryseobacterium artocarpi TaxID=1414727 RepID=A0A1B8ZZY6_9FLAO|nr:hypothetical protein [Chryseobacterium artocarpi]OCA77157.1 hypothetical protein BBI01_01455 [Chryseobacterium artocarpi]
MGELILTVLGVLILILTRVESAITNTVVIAKVNHFHSRVKVEMESIITEPYSETRKKTMRWVCGLFIGLAIVNLFSAKVFGPDSIKNPLKNPTILYSTIMLMILLLGNFNRSDLLRYVLLFTLSGIFAILLVHNPLNLFAGFESLFKGLPGHPIFKDVFIGLGTIAIIMVMLLLVFVARGAYYIFYLVLRFLFSVSIKGNEEKPLKSFVFVFGILSTLALSLSALI